MAHENPDGTPVTVTPAGVPSSVADALSPDSGAIPDVRLIPAGALWRHPGGAMGEPPVALVDLLDVAAVSPGRTS